MKEQLLESVQVFRFRNVAENVTGSVVMVWGKSELSTLGDLNSVDGSIFSDVLLFPHCSRLRLSTQCNRGMKALDMP